MLLMFMTLGVLSALWSLKHTAAALLRSSLIHSTIHWFFSRPHWRSHLCYSVASVCLSSVCNICVVAKWCVLPKNCMKKQIGNPKWHMGNRMVTWPMTSRDPEWSSRDPNTLKAQYLDNSCRCYL